MNGRLDTSFGGGVVLLDTGGEEVALAVAVTANGKVVVGGRSYGPGAGVCCTMDGLVARYRIDKAGSTSLWCGSRPAASSTAALVAAEW